MLEFIKAPDLPAAGSAATVDELVFIQGGQVKRVQVGLLPSAPTGMGFTEVLVAGSATLAVPAGSAIGQIILVRGAAAAGAALVGTSVGGGQIIDDYLDGTHLQYSAAPNTFFPSSATVHFTGDFMAKIQLIQ